MRLALRELGYTALLLHRHEFELLTGNAILVALFDRVRSEDTPLVEGQAPARILPDSDASGPSWALMAPIRVAICPEDVSSPDQTHQTAREIASEIEEFLKVPVPAQASSMETTA